MGDKQLMLLEASKWEAVLEQNEKLAKQNDDLRDERENLRPLIWLRNELVASVRDILYWKWVIVLIAVEVMRMHLDIVHSQELQSKVQEVWDLLDSFLDAVAPGAPRG
jgi:hypothetical protein